MRRFTAKMVRSGLVTAWRLAGCPTSRSPSSVKATMEGVVRMPSEFSMTFGVLPSMTATHEFVVPRSIPMTLPIVFTSSLLRQVGWALSASPTEIPVLGAPLPTPFFTSGAASRRLLAHIGGRVLPARHVIAESRAKPRVWKAPRTVTNAGGLQRSDVCRAGLHAARLRAGGLIAGRGCRIFARCCAKIVPHGLPAPAFGRPCARHCCAAREGSRGGLSPGVAPGARTPSGHGDQQEFLRL